MRALPGAEGLWTWARPRSGSRWSEIVLGVLLVAVVSGAYWVKTRPVTAVEGGETGFMNAGLDSLYTRHDAGAAVEQFKKVLALRPGHYGATFQLAKALDAAGRGAEARPYWERMLKLAEDAHDDESLATVRARLQRRDVVTEGGLMQAGLDAFYARNDPNAAAVEFRKVLERNPTHYGATFQLAMALDRAGKPAEARPLWEKTLKMAEGYNDKKTADASRVRLAKPDVVSGRQSEGDLMKAGLDALYLQKDPGVAAVEFRKVLELNPTHYGATFQLAMALDRAGKRAEARPLWEKVATMADGYKDPKTLDAARARLAEKP